MTQPPGPVQGPIQPQYPPLPPEPPPKKKRGWLIALIVIGGLILFGSCVAGLANLGETSSTTSTASSSADDSADDAAVEGEISSKQPTKSSAKAKPKIDNTIGNGLHEVGVDVQAGQYKTDVPDSESCYWARHKDDSGELDAIIANENIDGPARASVTIKKGEFFESGDCGVWKKVG